MDENIRLRILLVEDSALPLFAEKMMLERHGFSVDDAATGEAAVTLAKREAYDLILMDIEMGHTTGFDIAKEIRRDSLNMETVIVALTSQSNKNYQERAVVAKMQGFLRKPLTDDKVEEILKKYFPQVEREGSSLDNASFKERPRY